MYDRGTAVFSPLKLLESSLIMIDTACERFFLPLGRCSGGAGLVPDAAVAEAPPMRAYLTDNFISGIWKF